MNLQCKQFVELMERLAKDAPTSTSVAVHRFLRIIAAQERVVEAWQAYEDARGRGSDGFQLRAWERVRAALRDLDNLKLEE